MMLGRSALHALPESWEGVTADEAAGHGVRAQQSALELADRGDRIGDVHPRRHGDRRNAATSN